MNAGHTLEKPPLPKAPPPKPNSPPSERRIRPRISLEAEVSLASESQFFTGLTRNVSQGGVFVATYDRAHLTIGAHVEIKVKLPDGEFAAKGVVRWVREQSPDSVPGVGIAFDGLEPAAAEHIERFCKEREPLYHDV